MQRKPTKNTRGPNAAEKRFQGWLKFEPCVWCGNPGPGIVDHCKGATYRHLKVLIGHWFCLSVCVMCDTNKTIHGKRNGNEAEAWLEKTREYSEEIPEEVRNSIKDWGR